MPGTGEIPAGREAQIRRGRLLEYTTLCLVGAEAIVGVIAGGLPEASH